VLKRSQLHRLTEGDGFIWATGIEDTFIADPWPKSGRILDEYELTGHYERWSEDLDLMASLGIKYARYGIPWYRINPEPHKWDWEWPDRVFDKMLRLGIQPIVDLMHYGTPAWLEQSFANSDYPERVAEYAHQTASRYKGRIGWYTPLNEPRITAWYCGKLGWWPPYLRGWKGFLKVMLGVSKGVALTSKALASVDSEFVQVHVDATDLFIATTPDAEAEATLRQELVFLALDLITGRVGEDHPLMSWLRAKGMSDGDVDWFQNNICEPDIVGINMYPMFTLKELSRANGRLKSRMRYAEGGMVSTLCRMYYERYRRPIMITETASVGNVRRRSSWLNQSITAVRECRESGIPVVGYTWWPMFALVTWGYRQQGLKELSEYILQMGLWNFDVKGSDPLRRVQTSLVEEYKQMVTAQDKVVGQLRTPVGRA
jgi:beta-glucosidase